MSIATATTTEDRELFAPAAAYDAAKREIREGNDVYRLQCRNGTWTGWPVETWDTLERTLFAIVTRELGRHHPDRVDRQRHLLDMAEGRSPLTEQDAIKVRTIQSAKLADLRRKERGFELAADLNRAESVAPVPVGAAAGGSN